MSAWTDLGAWTIPDTAVHALDHNGRRWRVTVAEPPMTRPGGGLRPVLYVLDPFGTLGTAVHVTRTTHVLSGGALPALVVVGVGPDTDDLAELQRLRSLDLTPSPPAPDASPSVDGLIYGGAEDFLDLLTSVVAPHVEDRHDADQADRTLAGWSLGGLFAAYALLTRPAAFRRYLLVSPSLYWAGDQLFQRVSSLVCPPGDLKVYLAAGDLEEAAATRAWPRPTDLATAETGMRNARMVSNTRRFAEALVALHLPTLSITAEILRGEHHTTQWASALTRGLLALHGDGYRLDA